MGMGASATNPIPEASKEDVLAATKLLGPDECDTITFTAPPNQVFISIFALSPVTSR